MLLQDRALPNLAALVAGESVEGSWWGHAKGRQILRARSELMDHPDVATFKLVSKKVTFVHRQLWPSLMAIGCARSAWQMARLSSPARALLARIDEETEVVAAGPAVQGLERRLLVASKEVHSVSGAHVIALMNWAMFARQTRMARPRSTEAPARDRLETLLTDMNETYGGKGDTAMAMKASRGGGVGRHVYFFTMATTFWALYFLAGLPSDYFQTWPFGLQFALVLAAPTLALGAIGYLRFRRMERASALALARTMAFHFTAPLLFYDWLYLSEHRAVGRSFLQSHWYLSIFYLVPWAMLPALGWGVARETEGEPR